MEKLFKAGFLRVSMLSSAQQTGWRLSAISGQGQLPEAKKETLNRFAVFLNWDEEPV
jgi:hypothetical protein